MGTVDLIWDLLGFVICATVIFFSQENIIYFFDWATDRGWRLGPEVAWLGRARRCGSGSWKKNPYNKQIGFRPRVMTCGSGPDMKKPNLNPTCCHSYPKVIAEMACGLLEEYQRRSWTHRDEIVFYVVHCTSVCNIL